MTRHAQLLIAIALCGGAAAACRQAPEPLPFSADVRDHVQAERFQVVTSVRGLPLGVRDALQKLFESPTLDIADPGAEFQASDHVVDPALPRRRLRMAGCSVDHCLVYYERAGFAPTWHAVLIAWTPDVTEVEWGGMAPAGLRSVDDVRHALLTGAVKAPAFW